MSLEVCPGASPKFWRFAGWTKYCFKNTMRKLRSIAFQRCITLYSQKWTVWPWEAIFYQKMLHKQLFREALNPDSLTSEQSGTPNFKNLTSFNMFPENLGAKAFRWAIGKPAGIKIVRSAAAWNISWGGPQEMQKLEFFASFASPRKFCEEKFYQDRTMWKSTDSAFRICMTLGGPDDFSHSYCSSKSEEGGKSGLVPKIKGCHKKKTRPQFFFKTLFLLREVFKSNLETSLRRNKV